MYSIFDPRVEAHLDRKSQLINKYQTETNDLMEQV